MYIRIMGLPRIAINGQYAGLVVMSAINTKVAEFIKFWPGQFGDAEYQEQADPNFFIVEKSVGTLDESECSEPEFLEAVNSAFDGSRFTLVFKTRSDLECWVATEVRRHFADNDIRAVVDCGSYYHSEGGLSWSANGTIERQRVAQMVVS